MSRSMVLLSSAVIVPAEFLELVRVLGGESSPAG